MLQRLASPFRTFGAFGGVVYLADRLLRALGGRSRALWYEFQVLPLRRARPLLSAARAARYRLDEIAPDAPELAGMPPVAAVLAMRFNQGSECYVLRRDDEVVAYFWCSFGAFAEDEARLRYELPGPDAMFDYDVYIYPDHRVGFVFAALWQAISERMVERGVHWSYSRVSRLNVASIQSHRRLGAASLGSALVVALGPLEIVLASRAPWFGLTWGRDGAGAQRRIRFRLARSTVAGCGAAEEATGPGDRAG